MNWKIVDSAMTPWRTKIKDLQIERGIGNSEGCFDCEHWENCYASISEKNKVKKNNVSKGEWTYVGHQYGEALVNGKKAKILFVSMLKQIWDEKKLKKGEDFESVQKGFRTGALERINPHMGGVDVELEHLLDEGTSREDRCQQFALTNAVRCCFLLEETSYHATGMMEKNCASHTKAIIQALEPDIIIAQGTNPRNSMCELFDIDLDVETYCNGRTGRSSRSVDIAKKEIGADKQVLFLLTAHPARYPGFGWKAGYLPAELKKAFERAREIYSGTDNDKAAIRVTARDEKIVMPDRLFNTVMPDRLFNTNEKNAPDAYIEMFDKGVIAIYGPWDDPKKLRGSTEGQRVFAYVNGKGILAVGYILDSEPRLDKDTTVFRKDNEFHVEVDWETIVDEDKGVTCAEVKAKHGYNLPCRHIFCNMRCSSAVTDWIANKLQCRAK